MHELSLCQSLIHILEHEALKQRFNQVVRVYLEVGELAGVEVAALKFAFDAIKRDTLAASAKLEVIPVAGQAWCTPCQRTVTLHHRADACPTCGGFGLNVTGGTDMRIAQLEVSEQDQG
jgi:hydrogenase nickel incorporation protein HypA/HybF